MVVVIAVAGWKGVRGLIGLGVAGAIFFGFMLPALATGRPAVAVALVGGSAIMFAVLYLAHGISMRTTSAFVGTLVSLLATAGLGALGVWAARLSGLSTDETIALAGQSEGLSFTALLTCSLVIAGLGVLNDTTITQASAVWELRAAGPHLSRWDLFTAGMRIGRDHIASTIYTIVFAYAGAALSTLVLLSLYSQPLDLLLSTEPFAEEIVRTLGPRHRPGAQRAADHGRGGPDRGQRGGRGVRLGDPASRQAGPRPRPRVSGRRQPVQAWRRSVSKPSSERRFLSRWYFAMPSGPLVAAHCGMRSRCPTWS